MLWWSIRKLSSSNWRTRKKGAQDLATQTSQEVVRPLITALMREQNQEVICVIVDALLLSGNQQATQAVRHYLLSQKGETEVIAVVVRAMLKNGDESAADAVQQFFLADNRNTETIRAAVIALLKSGEERAFQAVRDYLGAEKQASRLAAISQSVATVFGVEVAIDLLIEPAMYRSRDHVLVKTLFSFGEAATNHVVGRIQDDNYLVQRSPLIRLLGASGDSSNFAALAQYIKLGEKLDVIEALGELGDPRAVELFRELLLIRVDWLIRENRVKAVADALGHIKHPESVKMLEEFMDHGSSRERVAAIDALQMIGDSRSVERLRQALSDSDLKCRVRAGASLVKLRQPVDSTVLLDLIVEFIVDLKNQSRNDHFAREEYNNPSIPPLASAIGVSSELVVAAIDALRHPVVTGQLGCDIIDVDVALLATGKLCASASEFTSAILRRVVALEDRDVELYADDSGGGLHLENKS